MDPIYDRLKRKPATKTDLVEEFHADPIDIRNRLQALKAKGLVYVASEPPRWFAKGYALPDDASNELIRERLIAFWVEYDPSTDVRIRLANMVKRVGQILDKRQGADQVIGQAPTGELVRQRDQAEFDRTAKEAVETPLEYWTRVSTLTYSEQQALGMTHDAVTGKDRTEQEQAKLIETWLIKLNTEEDMN